MSRPRVTHDRGKTPGRAACESCVDLPTDATRERSRLHCYHSACDPYHHGSIAYYGIDVIGDEPHFEPNQLGEFFDFIRQHARTHGESF